MNMITKAAIKEKGFYCKYLKNPNINNYILLVIIRNKFFVFVHTGDIPSNIVFKHHYEQFFK